MNDEKKMKILRKRVMIIAVIFMCITLAFQLWALFQVNSWQLRVFQLSVHTILCSLVLLSLSVTLVIDGILKSGKKMAMHGGLYALWLLNLLIQFVNLFKIF